MDILNPEILKELSKEQPEYVITFTLNAKPIVGGNLANPTMFRNLIKDARNKLSDSNLNSDDIEKFLKPAIELADNDSFWHDQFTSLIVFLSQNTIQSFKLPIEAKDQVYVSHYYHLLPLFEYFTVSNPYYLLLVDEGGSQLFWADKYQIFDISTDKIRISEENIVLERIEREEEQFYHVGQEDGRSKNHEGVMFHGHGNVKDDRKVRANQYLNIIEKEVMDVLDRSFLPLVLAGHDFLVSIYAKQNTYKYLLPSHIRTSPGPLDIKQLHKESIEVANEYYDKELNTVKEKFFDLINTGKVSIDLLEIINGARQGKIDTLFINLDRIAYGSFEVDSELVFKLTKTDNISDEDLSNLAAALAISENAEIYAVHREQMPEESNLCAIFRY